MFIALVSMTSPGKHVTNTVNAESKPFAVPLFVTKSYSSHVNLAMIHRTHTYFNMCMEDDCSQNFGWALGAAQPNRPS